VDNYVDEKESEEEERMNEWREGFVGGYYLPFFFERSVCVNGEGREGWSFFSTLCTIYKGLTRLPNEEPYETGRIGKSQ
jgi:hypothetical protein